MYGTAYSCTTVLDDGSKTKHVFFMPIGLTFGGGGYDDGMKKCKANSSASSKTFLIQLAAEGGRDDE